MQNEQNQSLTYIPNINIQYRISLPKTNQNTMPSNDKLIKSNHVTLIPKRRKHPRDIFDCLSNNERIHYDKSEKSKNIKLSNTQTRILHTSDFSTPFQPIQQYNHGRSEYYNLKKLSKTSRFINKINGKKLDFSYDTVNKIYTPLHKQFQNTLSEDSFNNLVSNTEVNPATWIDKINIFTLN